MIRSLAKRATYLGLRCSGINALGRALRAKKLLVVTYHGVLREGHAGDRFGYENTVGTDEFDRHLGFLRRKFQPVALGDLLAWARGERELPPRAAFVTFDDGYRNNLTHAAPLLAKHGVPATVFVSTAYIGGTRILWPTELVERIVAWPLKEVESPGERGPLPVPAGLEARRALAKRIVREAKRQPSRKAAEYMEYLRSHSRLDPGLAADDLHAFLTWDEVRRLAGMGVDIGSHGVAHSILSRLSPEDLLQELRESKSRIEGELDTECASLAFPNGTAADWSAEVLEGARRCGYRLGFAVTNDFHPHAGNPMAIGRFVLPGHVPQEVFEAIASGSLLSLNHLLGRRPEGTGA